MYGLTHCCLRVDVAMRACLPLLFCGCGAIVVAYGFLVEIIESTSGNINVNQQVALRLFVRLLFFSVIIIISKDPGRGLETGGRHALLFKPPETEVRKEQDAPVYLLLYHKCRKQYEYDSSNEGRCKLDTVPASLAFTAVCRPRLPGFSPWCGFPLFTATADLTTRRDWTSGCPCFSNQPQGIGKECCRYLASLEGYRVMMGCRYSSAAVLWCTGTDGHDSLRHAVALTDSAV